MAAGLEKLLGAVEMAALKERMTTLHQMMVFLIVAGEEGISVGDISRRAKQGSKEVLSPNATLKVCRYLSDEVHNLRKGVGLVRLDKDQNDRRVTTVFLTDDGKVLAAALAGLIK